MVEYSNLSKELTKILPKEIKKNNGIFFTPPETIYENIELIEPYIHSIKNVLEPSCGSCEYIKALSNKYPNINITGIENNEIIYDSIEDNKAEIEANLASKDEVKIIVKGHIHTDVLMKEVLKREYNLLGKTRLSHIWHMTISKDDKPLIITDGALNVLPNVKTKMHILRNVIDFSNRIGNERPKIAILSATEEVLDSVPSSVEANEITKLAKEDNLNADVFGPLAFDNSISKKSAAIKGVKNIVAGDADVLLVPSVEAGNSLVKMMIYFMGACAAGVVVGGKVPIVITSRSDEAQARLASIAAAVVALD